MGAEDVGRHMKVLVDVGASIVGGCGGTNASYIRALKKYL